MNTKTLAACLGLCLVVSTAPADPLIIQTMTPNGQLQLVEGMNDGWTVAISDTGINGDDALMFVAAPSYRVLEYDPERDPPIQPVPELCFPDDPRILLGLGPWPEGNLNILGWDGNAWAARETLPSLYAGQENWGTAWGRSVSTTANGEYLLVGSTGTPGVAYRVLIGDDCSDDYTTLPGAIIPRGHLDLFQFSGGNWAQIATIGPPVVADPTSRVVAPISGQPSAFCACFEEAAHPVQQNGLGWATSMFTFDNEGRESLLMLSGMPWYDGNGAYPRFSGNDIVIEEDDTVGTCCLFDGTTLAGTTSIDCAIAGGMILDSAFTDCSTPTACCIGDTCAVDALPYACRLMGGFPYPDEICDDDPCPSEISLPVIEPGHSDPTACGRGGGFLTLYDPLSDTYTPVTNALDSAGDPILANGYGPGILGLIPDPLAATGDPFPHQVMGYSVDATQEDGTLWVAIGAPFAGGVSGINAGDAEPECGISFFPDLGIGPLVGRMLMYTVEIDNGANPPATTVVTIQHRQTIIADDAMDFMGFGASVSLSGSRMVVGAPQWQSPTSSGGAAYVFELNGSGLWSQTHRLHQLDADDGARFGSSVSLHEDKLVVGAPLQGATVDGVYHGQIGAMHRFNFAPATATWTETEVLAPPTVGDVFSPNPGEQQFGRSVAITDRFVSGGGPQLVNAVDGLFGVALTNTGAVGITDSRPIPTSPPPPPMCLGDVDDSNTVDIRDVIIMLRGMREPELYPQCDVNNDTSINVIDLVDMINEWGNDC